MRVTKNILIVILFLSAVTFSLQNAEEVMIHYYSLIPPLAVPLFIFVLAAVLLGVIVGAVGEVLTDVKLRMELRKQKKKIDEIKREQKIQESEVLTKPEFPLSSTIKDQIYEPPGQLKSFWNIFRGELHLRTASDPIFSSSQHLLEKLTVRKEGYPYAKEVRWVRSGMLVIYENRILMALLKEATVPQLAPPPR